MPVQSEHHSHGHAVFPWPQLLMLLTGCAMLLYGMVGFRYSGLPGVPEASRELLGIAVDPIRDVIHLVLGVAGLLCATRLSAARAYGWVLLVVGAVEVLVCLLIGVFGVLPSGPFVTNVGSVVAAVVFGVLGLVVALGRVRQEMPYGGLQRGMEQTGRRLVGLRGRSRRSQSDESQ
ncbi:DUF4383 domain-containing protein [Pseudonocardia parietis]|uniref:Lysylphosphatidylglycerol synthetase-like protein (DUF2156 family) n=1 Tax=Pseudonocardia parietis TaxID=570936 RepID=A0ABS4W774_9PSEU|nr:DUF4383 domain-containing protein [Pseudonocardia parietis]MBP2372061.1 lysylphosphatidylglycerol synthetase-like protein (DUF2156 family) [Pseudonocardia parietis]